MATATAAFSGLVAAVTMACGCTLNTGVPTVDKDALQADIADRLAKAGAAAQSVTCKEDLVGEVGRTARCDVVLSPTNSFEPVVKVTGVNGTTIDYEVTPAVSKEQLERTVARLVVAAGGQADSVSCETGLNGEVGAVAHCDIEAGGVQDPRDVKVNKVEGLLMNFDLVPQ